MQALANNEGNRTRARSETKGTAPGWPPAATSECIPVITEAEEEAVQSNVWILNSLLIKLCKQHGSQFCTWIASGATATAKVDGQRNVDSEKDPFRPSRWYAGTTHTRQGGRQFFKEPSTVHSSNAPGIYDFGTRSIIGKHFWDFCEPSSRVRSPDHHREWSGGATVKSSALHVLCVYIYLFTTLLRYTAETFWRVTFRRKRSPTTNAHSEAPTDHALPFFFHAEIPTHECHRFYLLFSFTSLDGIFRRKGKFLRDCGGWWLLRRWLRMKTKDHVWYWGMCPAAAQRM